MLITSFELIANWYWSELNNVAINYIYCFLKVVSAIFLLIYFVYLKQNSLGTRKNVFYFTSKALFVLEIINF